MTALNEVKQQLKEIANGVSDLRERLVRVEEKVNFLSAHTKNGKETDEDHERRIRTLELSHAKVIGWATGAGLFAGGLVSALWRKLFG